MTGGSAGSGGYTFQALVIAFVEAHVLVGRKLGWLDTQLGKPDVPVAVGAETGGGGDDVSVELGFHDFEAQAKHGLRVGPRLDEAVNRFARVLGADPSARGVIVVDQTSSPAVKDQLRVDLQRLRDGRDDDLKDVTVRVLGRIAALGISNAKEVAGRLTVICLDLEEGSSAHSNLAQLAIRERLSVPSEEERAWDALATDGDRLMRQRGRRDRQAIEKYLGGKGVVLVSRRLEIVSSDRDAILAPVTDRREPVAIVQAEVDLFDVIIKEAAGLLNAGEADSALALLERTQVRFSGDTPSGLRYRVSTNIGVAYLQLQQFDAARTQFETALTFDAGGTVALGNLAQAELFLGNLQSADFHAMELLRREPLSALGWSVRLQVASKLGRTVDLPADLEREPSVLGARGYVALQHKRFSEARELFERALSAGSTDVEMPQLLAEALVLESAGAVNRRPILERALQILEQAPPAGAGRRHAAERERALLLRASIYEILDRRDDARNAFDQALAIPNHSTRVELLVARSRLESNDAEAAAALLDRIPPPERDADALNLLARASAQLGRHREAEAALEAIPTDALSDANTAIETTETAIASGLTEKARELMRFVDASGAPAFRGQWLRARLASQDNDPNAVEAFERAIEIAPESERPLIQLELANHLARREEYARSIQLFEDAGAANRGAVALRWYARALYGGEEFTKLHALIQTIRQGGALPDWCVDLMAEIALRRQDFNDAVAWYREVIRRRPGDQRAQVNLAASLLALNRVDEARQVAHELAGNDQLSPEVAILVAHVLVALDERTAALHLAHSALKRSPADPDIQLAYVNAFLQQEASTQDELRPMMVGPNTWVELKAGKNEIEYHIVEAEVQPDVTRHQLSPTEGLGRRLCGLGRGDRIMLHEGMLTETQYEVTEIKSDLLHSFQEVMTHFPARFPENTNLQAFQLGDEVSDLAPLIAVAEQQAKTIDHAVKLYREQGLPLGFLAAVTHKTVRDAYCFLAFDPSKPRILVEAGDPESQAQAQVVADEQRPIVLTASALTTLDQIGKLKVLRQWASLILAPVSLEQELMAEIRELDEVMRRGGDKRFGKGDAGRLTFTEVPAETLSEYRGKVDQLLLWLRANVELVARSVEGLDTRSTKLRKAIGDSSADAITVAKGCDGRIYADDFGLRRLAASEEEVKGFSSYPFFRSARMRELMSEEEFNRAVIDLILLKHEFIPISAETLYVVLVDSGFLLENRVLRTFDRLRAESANTDTAVAVAAELLRKVALSTAGPATLGTIAMLCFEVLTADRDLVPTLRALISNIRRLLALVPSALELLERQLRAFLASKTLKH
jgi:tetratricopeptide (TPR) repeat protein